MHIFSHNLFLYLKVLTFFWYYIVIYFILREKLSNGCTVTACVKCTACVAVRGRVCSR